MDQKLWLKRQNMHKTNMLVKTSLNSEKKSLKMKGLRMVCPSTAL